MALDDVILFSNLKNIPIRLYVIGAFVGAQKVYRDTGQRSRGFAISLWKRIDFIFLLPILGLQNYTQTVIILLPTWLIFEISNIWYLIWFDYWIEDNCEFLLLHQNFLLFVRIVIYP